MVVHEFERHDSTRSDPAHCLFMAIHYHIDAWVEPSIRTLLKPDVRFNKLASKQIEYLKLAGADGHVYDRLVNTRFELDQIRLMLMWFEPPYTQNYLCTRPGLCKVAWNTQWWGGIGKAFLNPTKPFTCQQLRDEISNPAFSIAGVCKECCMSSVAPIIAGSHLLKEEEIIQGIVAELSAFQTRREDRDRLSKLATQMMITEDGRMYPQLES